MLAGPSARFQPTFYSVAFVVFGSISAVLIFRFFPPRFDSIPAFLGLSVGVFP